MSRQETLLWIPCLVVVAASLAGCGEGTAPVGPLGAAPTQAPSTAKVAPIPCFPDEGPAVLRIAGVPVGEAVVVRSEKVMRLRLPGMSAETLRRKTIEDAIVPMAALYAGHAERIGDMSQRIRAASARLTRGDSFDAVAMDTGDDLSARNGGLYGTVTRSSAGIAQLPPGLEDRVFGATVALASDPFAGLVGFQIIRVDKAVVAADGKSEQRDLRHILVHYDALMASRMRKIDIKHPQLKELLEQWQSEFTEKSRRLIQEAKVEVLDPAWRPLIYSFRLAK